MKRFILVLPALLLMFGFAYGDDKHANLYVVAIADDRYDKKHNQHDFDKPARRLKAIFSKDSTSLYRTVEVKMLLGRAAHRDAILKKIAWLQKVSTGKDTVFFYIGAHGGRDEHKHLTICVGSDKPGKNGKDISKELTGDELHRGLSKVKGQVILALDCCHAGTFIEQFPKCKFAVLCACRANESEGYFGYELADVLAGKSRIPIGVIHLKDLADCSWIKSVTDSGGKEHPVTLVPNHMLLLPLTKH